MEKEAGGYKGVTENLVVTEQFNTLTVVVVTRSYTSDKIAQKNIHTYRHK